MQRGTAIGSGIVLSLATIFPEAGIDLSQITGARPMPPGPNDKPPPDFKPVPPGSYPSAAIILLTDGQRTTGPDSLEAAKMAADRGVRIYTVGIGTKEGETIGFEGWSMRVRLDEDTLKAIANLTRADYFYAGTAADLKKVYQGPQHAPDRREEGDRDQRAARRARRRARGARRGALGLVVRAHRLSAAPCETSPHVRPNVSLPS